MVLDSNMSCSAVTAVPQTMTPYYMFRYYITEHII
jgi:hypothetical protein